MHDSDDEALEITSMRPQAGERGTLSRFARLPGGRRLSRAVAWVAVLCLVVVVFATGLHLGASSPPAPGSTAAFVGASGVPWGTLLVDGKRVATHPPNAPRFTLARGSHQLRYHAEPWPDLACSLSVPAVTGDTCVIDAHAPLSADESAAGVLPLDLGAHPNRLPPDALAQLTGVTQRALDARSTRAQVLPGETYLRTDANGAATVDVAHVPMQAFTTTTVATQPATGKTFGSNGETCSPWCVNPAVTDPALHLPTGWLLNLVVELGWTYRADDGTLLSASPATARETFVGVAATWQSGWHVDFLSTPEYALCEVGLTELMQRWSGYGHSVGLPSKTTPGAPIAAGCLYTLTPNTATGTPSTGVPATVLYRFGVLLAVDDAAHTLFPDLPIATAPARAAAQRIASQG